MKAWLGAVGCLAILTCLAEPAELSCRFGEAGLLELAHGPTVLVTPERAAPSLDHLLWLAADGSQVAEGAPKPSATSYEAATQTLRQTFPWGSLTVQYGSTPRALTLQVTLRNESQRALAGAELRLLSLQLPHTPANVPLAGERLPLYTHEHGVIGLGGLGELRRASDTPRRWRPWVLQGLRPPKRPQHPIVETRWFDDPGIVLAPGAASSWTVQLVAGAAGTSYATLFPDHDAEQARAQPMRLHWPDRRPIGMAFLANPTTGWATNPRGYLVGLREKNDVTTEAGLVAFGEALLAYADNCIARMKQMDAQGIIVWDIEGAEMPHMITYIGDPRHLAMVAPEMDRFADAFMARFRAAGLQTGITIRPTEVYASEGRWRFNQREVPDPLTVMDEKIQVAKRRWGCRIFYLDSNVFGDGLLSAEEKTRFKGVPWVMPVPMLAELQRRHPDCLIIPEWSNQAYYTLGAPYSSPNLGQTGTPAAIRRIWPTAFRAVAVSPGLLEAHWNSLRDSVQGGDVLLYPTWYSAPENQIVSLIYREAALRIKGPPADLSAARLLELARDPDEAVRYAVAQRLGEVGGEPGERGGEVGVVGGAAASAALAGLLGDASPVVRKQALEVFAGGRVPFGPDLVNTLLAALQGGKDPVNNALRPFFADALGAAGETAVPGLTAVLLSEQRPAWPYALRAISATNTSDPAAVAALLAFLTAPADQPRAQCRLAAVIAAGKLRLRAAVPALLALLTQHRQRDDEGLRGQIVVALGQIGDPTAIPAILGELETRYTTVEVYRIEDRADQALRALTGVTGIIGRQEWLAWHRAQLPLKTP